MFFMNKFKQIEGWGKKGNIEKLGAAVNNNDPEVRSAAARALGEVKKDEAVNMLIPLLRDPEPKVRVGAADALSGLADARAVEHLRHQLEREQDPAAMESLRQAMKCLVKN